MEFLTIEEINKDLSYNFPGRDVNFELLVDPLNSFLAPTKEDAVIGYTCGYRIREFFKDNDLYLSMRVSESLPLVFVINGVKEFYRFPGQGRGSKVLDELQKIGIINFGFKPFGYRKVAFYSRNFKEIENRLSFYASEINDIKRKDFKRRFDKTLGSISPYVDQISKLTFDVYKRFKLWWKQYKKERGRSPQDYTQFNFRRMPLDLSYLYIRRLI